MDTEQDVNKRSFKRQKLSECFTGILEDEYETLIKSGKSIKEEIQKTWKY
jgi:hypothetical protein